MKEKYQFNMREIFTQNNTSALMPFGQNKKFSTMNANFYPMKSTLQNFLSATSILLLLLAGWQLNAQTVVTLDTPGAGTWTVPAGVTEITVEVWGAGGGSSDMGNARAGGGGGAYASSVLTVVPGDMIPYFVGAGGAVGAGGGLSQWNSSQVLANGGGPAPSNNSTGGPGGGFGIGDQVYFGGSGAVPTGNNGGGGGGSAFSNAVGGDASGTTGGIGQGNGGNGGLAINGDGDDGNAPGGGGGGKAGPGGGANSGSGANGQILVTYNDCAGSDLAVTISGNTTITSGCSTTLTADATGGEPDYTYVWSTGATTQDITVSPAFDQTYFVTVTDDNGCTATASVEVTVEAVAITEVCACDDGMGNVSFAVTFNPWPSCSGPYNIAINYTSTSGTSQVSINNIAADPSGMTTVLFSPVGNALPNGTVQINIIFDQGTMTNIPVSTSTVSYEVVDPIEITECAEDMNINTEPGECYGIVPDLTGLIMFTGGCGASVVTQSPVAGSQFGTACGDTQVITFTVTNNGCQTEVMCTATLTLIDEEEPVADGTETSATVECPDDTDTPPTLPIVTDNCGGILSPVGPPVISTKPTCEGTRTYTYTYEDGCGNELVWVFTYTVDRTTAPSEVGGPVSTSSTVECPSAATAPATLPVVEDVCGNVLPAPTPVVTETPDPVTCEGTIAYTYTYTDCAGINFVWTYTYTIDRTTAPSEVGGPVSTSSTVECPSAVTAPTTLPVVEDVCGNTLPAPTPVVTQMPDPVTCEGTIAYTYTYTDCAGLNFVWTYTYTIDRTTAPSEVGGPVSTSSTVECPSAATAPMTLPVVEDVCGNVLPAPTPVVTETPDPVTCEGTIAYTYTYTDCAGLNFVWTYTYTIDRTTAPSEVGGPVSTSSTVECPSAATAPATLPVVEDVCGNVLPAPTPVVTETPDPVTCEGTIAYTYTYTDCAGLNFVWTYTYTIDRTTAPSEVGGPVSTSSTVECPSAVTAPMTLPVVEDVCGNTLPAPTPVVTQMPNPVTCEGTIAYTYTYTDCAGLNFVWTYTYTIDRTTAPSEVGGPVSTSSTVECPSAATAPTTLPVVEDVCGNTLPAPTPVVTQMPDPVTCEGTIAYTYTYTDCAGLNFVWTYTYTIDRTTAPSEVGGPVSTSSTVECPSAATAPTTLPVVEDVCGNTLPAPTPVVTQMPDPVTCEGTIAYTYTYTDCAGLNFVWTYTYTIDRTTAPSEVGGPVSTSSTVECPSAATAPMTLPVVEDVCGNVLPAPTPVVTETPDPVTCEGTIAYTYTYTDCAGLNFVWTYTYTIDRTTAPSEVGGPVATSSTVQCPSAATAPATLPVVEDVCGNVLTAPTPVVTQTPDPVTCEGTVEYEYTYIDCSGLEFVWTYTYTIDLPALVIPADGDITVNCPADAVQPMPPVVMDACNNSITPSGPVDSGTSCSSRTYTWTYEDCTGTTYEWSFVYTITPPAVVLSCPTSPFEALACQDQADINTAFTNFLNSFSFTGGCEGDDDFDGTPMAPDACGGSTDVTYRVESACAADATCTVTFTVPTPPAVAITCPAPAMVAACDATAIAAAYTAWLADVSASGACMNLTITNNSTGTPDACGEVANITFTVTDNDCGLTTSCMSTFTVEDYEPIMLEDVEDEIVSACLTQSAVDMAFNNWINGFGFTGDCNAIAFTDLELPIGICANTATRNSNGECFALTWAGGPDVLPSNLSVIFEMDTYAYVAGTGLTGSPAEYKRVGFGGNCSQTYQPWAGTFIIQNNSDPMDPMQDECEYDINGSIDGGELEGPDRCGGSITVTYTVSGDCETTSKTVTFTVDSPDEVSITCTDQNILPNQSQTAANAAYASWLADIEATVSGGCSTTVTNDGPATAPSVCVGGSVTVTFTVTSDCEDPVTCMATFTVPASTLSSNLSGTQTACIGTEILLLSNTMGGAPAYTHSWSVSPMGAGTFSNPTGTATGFTATMSGNLTVTHMVTDANGCTASSSIELFVPEDCDYEFVIEDPCVCNNDASVNGNNGSFAELVTITGPNGSALPSGQSWTVFAVNGAFTLDANVENTPGISSAPIMVGQALSYCGLPGGCTVYNGAQSGITLEAPFGSYYLTLAHTDHQGYAISVEGPDAPGELSNTVLSVSNVCFYPVLSVVSQTVACDTDGPFPLTGFPQVVSDPAFPASIQWRSDFRSGIPSIFIHSTAGSD
jgi:hypothetical protein